MIGVFDSGIGGLTVLEALRRRLPHGDFLYLACEQGAEGIVVACNTVSAVALPRLRLACPVPVWGMVDAGVDAATRATPGGRVAVIATEATIASGVFQRKLGARGCRVWAKACPALASAIEEDSPDVDVLIRHYLKEMPRVDTLLLACTHYPLRRAVFEKVAGPRVQVVDGAEHLAARVATEVEDEGAGLVRYRSGVNARTIRSLPLPARTLPVRSRPIPPARSAR